MQFMLAMLGLLATSAFAAPQAGTSDVYEAIKNLSRDPDGYVHIADDGVARSYNNDGKVLDYVRLSNGQIAQYLKGAGDVYANDMDHLHEVFDEVNGLDVEDDIQLNDPPTWLRPAVGKRDLSSLVPRGPLVEARQNPDYCRGRPCLTDAGCQFSGCAGCAYLDAVLPGGGGVCY